MKAAIAVALIVAAGPTSAQVVTEMTQERVQEAIQAGTEKEVSVYRMGGGGGLGTIWGTVSTPWVRVAAAASDAKKKYQTLTAADVPPEIIRPELVVYAPAQVGPYGSFDVVAIVVKSQSGEIIRPIGSETLEETFTNGLGGSLVGRSMRAWFPLSVISAKNEVRLVYSGGRGEVKWRFKPEKMR